MKEYSKCWLAYRRCRSEQENLLLQYDVDTSRMQIEDEQKIVQTAIREYTDAVCEMFGKQAKHVTEEGSTKTLFIVDPLLSCHEDGYDICFEKKCLVVTGKSVRGLLYGVYDLLGRVQREENLSEISVHADPIMPLRMVNHWDNMDGSIERGYSGESFFYKDYQFIHDERIEMYARLMASIGINATVINNVNVHQRETYLITDEYLLDVKKYADIFARYGIQLYLCVNFAAPMELADSPVSDPLDDDVISWWDKAVQHVYEVIPEFGGFVVKADSEGRPGPFTYGRTQADGANMLARALKPYGGTLVWRCFVYNCGQDWRDRKTDRAKASYDYFMDLDGQFDDNVILQIKNGPMDFQVREPVSPLFGGLKKTNAMLEVQIAQEYTGQQKDVCYLIPMWKEVLAFDTYADGKGTTVEKVVSGQAYGNTKCGIAGVINTGNDANWTGNDLAAANLYGYGKLTFFPQMSAEEIAKEWAMQTFSTKKNVVKTITDILMMSWPVYEKYTVPLGIGWMVTPHFHYGPDIDGYEYDRWGTYHRADWKGLGVDRTQTGTGFTMQYNEPWSSIYESKEDCPEELLLFFHYVEYTKQLKSGKTLIQHIYDTHFEGVEALDEMITLWNSLENEVDAKVYQTVVSRFEMQRENACEWRDRVNTYFYRKSGIDDEKHRKIYC